MIEGEAENG